MPTNAATRPLIRRGLVLIGLAALSAVVWTVLTSDDAEPSASASAPAEGVPVVPQGDSTSLEPPGAPPEAAALCAPQSGEPERGDCRITAALADPPDVTSRFASSGEAERPVLPEGTPAPLPARRPASYGIPTLADAADPFVLVDGQTYFMFSTSAQFLNVPVAIVPAPSLARGPLGPTYQIAGGAELISPLGEVLRTDAMPVPPPWATNRGIWAPAVARFQGTYVMYFAAQRPNAPDPQNQECVGRAFASRPEGPYTAEETPFTCGLQNRLGALDPSVYVAPDGTAVLHVAFGGTSTPLWSIPLAADGSAAGAPEPLLGFQQRWESWFLENPAMIFDGRHYTLAYSAGDWRFPSYSTGLARCSTPRGPCRSEPTGPWLATAGAVSGPGGLSFFTGVDGRLMAAHHGYLAGAESLFGGRSTYIREVRLDADGISLQ